MASFNKITIVGYLGRDPELRHTPNGNAVCNLSVATTEKRNDRSGDAQETTTWFRVTVWGKQAAMCNEWLAKGRQVYIEGRVSLQEYTDREGQKRSSLEVNATDVKFLGGKGDNGNARDEAPTPAEKQARREALKTPVEVAKEVEQDDEIPF
jgi:single-strand DNA-binding protein